MSDIKISQELFDAMAIYCVFPDMRTSKNLAWIKSEIQAKLDRQIEHELYSKYKNKTLNDEERELARQQYLERRGIPSSFRW